MKNLTLLATILVAQMTAVAAPATAPAPACVPATSAPAKPVVAKPTQWEIAAREVIALPLFSDLNVKIKKKSPTQATSPASMALTDMGQCELQLKDRGNPQARVIENLVSAEMRPVWLRAIIVHELAHCWRNRDQPGAIDALYMEMGQAQVTGDPNTIASMVSAQQKEEIFADVAALSWVESAYPANYRGVLSAFVALRQHPQLSGPAHNTMPALARIMRHGMIYGETPFYAADTTLAVLGARGTTLVAKSRPAK